LSCSAPARRVDRRRLHLGIEKRTEIARRDIELLARAHAIACRAVYPDEKNISALIATHVLARCDEQVTAVQAALERGLSAADTRPSDGSATWSKASRSPGTRKSRRPRGRYHRPPGLAVLDQAGLPACQ
jgi:hypothetical protein